MNTVARPRLADVMQGIANAIRMIECAVTEGATAEPLGTIAEKQAIFDQVRSLAHRLLDLVIPGQDAIQLVNVGETIAAMAEMLHCTVGPQINLHLCICDDTPPLICDPGDLKDAILNILANARRVMVGGGDIDLSVDQEIQSLGRNFEEHYVSIEIESKTRTANQNLYQTGCEHSIAEEPEEKDRSPILELAREFAWQLGGSITVDGAVEAGMTIALRLPACVTRAGPVSAVIQHEPV